MIALWHHLQTHPAVASATCLMAASAAYAWHAWRLRRREREALRLVDERTGQWQDDAPARDARVLIVHARHEQREALASLLDGFGAQSVFADSPWAAGVATDQAEADGRPFDLVLLESSVEGAGADDGSVSARIDAVGLARLLAPHERERHAARACAGRGIHAGESPGLLFEPGTV